MYKVVAEKLGFGYAFETIKGSVQELGMRLPSWGSDVVVRVQYPEEHSKMTAPYLYVQSRFGKVPWKETMIELFSEEWQVVSLKETGEAQKLLLFFLFLCHNMFKVLNLINCKTNKKKEGTTWKWFMKKNKKMYL